MTYQEFKKIVEDTGKYYVTEDDESVFVARNNVTRWSVRVSKNIEEFIEFAIDTYGRNDGDLIRAVLELAETPLDEREPEKKYYLLHATKKEIEDIKKKYDVTLEDFEMVEVED